MSLCQPMPLQPSLVQNLMSVTPDWMSPSWIKSFNEPPPAALTRLPRSAICRSAQKSNHLPSQSPRPFCAHYIASLTDGKQKCQTIKCYLPAIFTAYVWVWRFQYVVNAYIEVGGMYGVYFPADNKTVESTLEGDDLD